MRRKLLSFVDHGLFALNVLIVFFLLTEPRLSLPPAMQVVGRMHPMFLHFPIVILFLAIAADLFATGRPQGDTPMKKIVDGLFLMGAFTASLTVIMGIFLSVEEGYSGSLLAWHKWFGAGIAGLAFLIVQLRKRSTPMKGLRLSYVATGIAIVIGGHLGSELTHGEDYLLSPLFPPDEVEWVSFEEARTFDHVIKPILDQKCMNCHNTRKAKGELVMEDSARLLKGGKTGVLFVRGGDSESLLLKRLMLPEDHKKHMPPAGKPQLNEEEFELLRLWVNAGAPFERPLTEWRETDTFRVLASARWSGDDTMTEPIFQFAAASPGDIAALQTDYRVLYPLSVASPALGVHFFNRTTYSTKSLEELTRVGKQIVDLNLNKMPVTDEDLQIIASFENLQRLNLNFTLVTGKGLSQLLPLKKLESLSLSGTSIRESDLATLSRVSSLEKLFIWNTEIEEEGVASINRILPGVAVETGYVHDGTILKLNPPKASRAMSVFEDSMTLVLSHPIQGVDIRYRMDNEAVDSVSTPLFKDPVLVTHPVARVTARAFKDGWKGSDSIRLYFVKRSFIPDSIALTTLPNDDYLGFGPGVLSDKIIGDTYFQGGNWLGYRERDAEVELYFNEPIVASSVTLDLLYNTFSYVFPPEQVEVYGSDENGEWKPVGKWNPAQPDGHRPVVTEPFLYTFEPRKVSALKIIARPVRRLPGWHSAKGEKAWVMIDEVLVN